jgi:hypothetical protein
MITYPIAMPAGAPAMATVRPLSTQGNTESPFTGEQNFFDWSREFWILDFALPPMRGVQADEWTAGFMLKLNGRIGTFYCGIPLRTSPNGVGTGTPLVMSAGQTGRTLITDGWTPSVAGILKVGDCFQLGSGENARVHQLTQTADSNASGQATLELWPRIQIAPADNAALILQNPVGVFRIMDADKEWGIEPGKIYTTRFSARSEV